MDEARMARHPHLAAPSRIAFPPSAPSEYLEGGTPKEKRPFLFQNAFPPPKIKCMERFFFRGCRRTRRRAAAVQRNRSVLCRFKPPRAPRVRNGFAHGLEYPHKKKLLRKLVRNANPPEAGLRAFYRGVPRRIRMVGGF
jgi:hypothetical protein